VKGRRALVFLILVILLAAALVLSVGIGAVRVAPASLFQIVLHAVGVPGVPQPDARDVTILAQLRLPRILSAMLVGATLAACGVVMQGLFRNPMASPEILGLSSGGSLGAVIAITTGLSAWSAWTMPVLTIAGALLAAACIYLLSTHRGTTSLLFIVISGMAISSLFNGLTSGLLLFARHYEVAEFVFWTMGGLEGRTWRHVLLAAPVLVPGIAALCLFGGEMNVLSLGEEAALSLGVGVERTKRLLLALCAVVTGIAIAVAGPVGFVGLLIPHFMRFLIGPDHRTLIPASALAGALFLILCDLLGRSVMPPFELRVGIITSVLGSPYLLALIIRLQRRGARAAR
jgi:iron complex transport system permease protein